MAELMPYASVTELDRLGPAETLAAYQARGGYEGLAKALRMTGEEIVAEVEKAGLEGHGGAGFPTAAKWRRTLDNPGPRYLVVNGAEGEPGSFKDRHLMARAPHQVVEGMLIAARAIGAAQILVYVNDAFPQAYESLKGALQELAASEWKRVLTAPIRLQLETHVYVAGEETALLSVLMGKPAVPWPKPPYPTEQGYLGRPTVVNNVETLAHVALIFRYGAESYRAARPRLFSVTGDVRTPGVYEEPVGTPLRSLLEMAGGMLDGQAVQAVLPGGYSMPWLTGSDLDVTLDPESLRARGSGLGASIIVIGSQRSLASVATQIATFLARATCETCPICVTGTARLARALEPSLLRPLTERETDAVMQLAAQHRHRGICALLDQAAQMAMTSAPALRVRRESSERVASASA